MLAIGALMVIGGAIGAWKNDEALGGVCLLVAAVGAVFVGIGLN